VPDQPDRTAGAQLTAAVLAALVPAARYAALVVQGNPAGSSAWLLARPDISATLAAALEQAREAAAEIVLQQWGVTGAPDSPLLEHLLADIGRQYGPLPHLHRLIRQAMASVPASERPAAVRRAIIGFARDTALRSRLTLVVAEQAARTAVVLAEGKDRERAGEKAWKRWKAHPEKPTCCHWCRNLHGVTIGLDESFLPYLGGPADLAGHGRLTQPPRPYRGELQGPGLHPHCECELVIVTEPASQPEPASPPAARDVLFTAAQIRAMPEQRYRALIAFLRAALHELGQVLRRLVSAA
jgi:hypothetical protein